jgi:hypothetical protein
MIRLTLRAPPATPAAQSISIGSCTLPTGTGPSARLAMLVIGQLTGFVFTQCLSQRSNKLPG